MASAETTETPERATVAESGIPYSNPDRNPIRHHPRVAMAARFVLTAIFVLAHAICGLEATADTQASIVIPDEYRDRVQALINPATPDPSRRWIIDSVRIDGALVHFKIRRTFNDAPFEFFLAYGAPESTDSACLPRLGDERISVCSDQGDAPLDVAAEWQIWARESGTLEKLSKAWGQSSVAQSSCDPDFLHSRPDLFKGNFVNPAWIRCLILSTQFLYAAIGLCVICLVLVSLSFLRTVTALPGTLSRRTWTGLIGGTVLLGLAKWFLLPDDNLVLIDEWQNLSAIREIANAGRFGWITEEIAGVTKKINLLDYPPLLHILSAAASLTGLSVKHSAALVNDLATSLTFPLFFMVGLSYRPKIGESALLLLSLLFATLPSILTLSLSASTVPLFVLLQLVILLISKAFHEDDRHRRRHFAGIVAAIVLATYSRFEALPLILGFFGILLLSHRRDGRFPSCYRQYFAAGCAIAITLAAPMISLFFLAKSTMVTEGSSMFPLSLLTRVPATLINFATFIFTPASFPVWLSLLVVVTLKSFFVNGRHKSDAPVLIFLLFSSLWLSFIYSLNGLNEHFLVSTFPRRQYYLGSVYVLFWMLLVSTWPERLPRFVKPWLAIIAIVLNCLGAAYQYDGFLASDRLKAARELAANLHRIEDDAIIVSRTSVFARFTADMDHVDFETLDPGMLSGTGRPLYYVVQLPESEQDISSQLRNTFDMTPVSERIFRLTPRARP